MIVLVDRKLTGSSMKLFWISRNRSKRRLQPSNFSFSPFPFQANFLITELITVRNGVAKVMFLQACVCPRGGVPDQVHPPGTRFTSWARYTPTPGVDTPPDQVHPSGPGTPPRTRYTPLGPGTPPQIRLLLRTVRVLLECILVSSWNPSVFLTTSTIHFASNRRAISWINIRLGLNDVTRLCHTLLYLGD